jgi:hypothetical protein
VQGKQGGGAVGADPVGALITYPYEALICIPGVELPADVDPAHRELSLHDAEFEVLFHMAKREFVALPRWKQVKLKKERKLF